MWTFLIFTFALQYAVQRAVSTTPPGDDRPSRARKRAYLAMLTCVFGFLAFDVTQLPETHYRWADRSFLFFGLLLLANLFLSPVLFYFILCVSLTCLNDIAAGALGWTGWTRPSRRCARRSARCRWRSTQTRPARRMWCCVFAFFQTLSF
jgi:hypothetical protein